MIVGEARAAASVTRSASAVGRPPCVAGLGGTVEFYVQSTAVGVLARRSAWLGHGEAPSAVNVHGVGVTICCVGRSMTRCRAMRPGAWRLPVSDICDQFVRHPDGQDFGRALFPLGT